MKLPGKKALAAKCSVIYGEDVMSRVGKKPIVLPSTVKAKIADSSINIEGPKGKLALSVFPGFKVEAKEKELIVKRPSESKKDLALHGTLRSLINNMVVGVSQGFTKELEIQGMGYRAQAQGKTLTLLLGFSHPIEFPVPEGVAIKTPKPNQITVEGIDKHQVGQVAAIIRDYYKPEPYKGKGIRYKGEHVRHKAGKKVA